jgi:hypothetical protein
MIVLVPVLLSVRYTKEEVFKLFLEIPNEDTKVLYDKCEAFLQSLQLGSDDAVVSEVDIEDALIENAPLTKKKKKRKYKTTNTNNYGLLIKLMLGTLVVVGYFILNMQETTLLK